MTLSVFWLPNFHIFDDGQDVGRCSCKLVDQSFFYGRMLMIKKSFVPIRMGDN